MSEIINLRRARKRRERAESERDAAANRARHGRTKAVRVQDEKQTVLERARLAGHRLDGSAGDEP